MKIHLLKLKAELKVLAVFQEPDLDYEVTAIAVLSTPDIDDMMSHIQLL